MATTYENMVLNEAHRREHLSQKEWGKAHGGEATIYPMGTLEFAKLESLKDKVADLVDLQPTPASMVRPPRKVRARVASKNRALPSAAPHNAMPSSILLRLSLHRLSLLHLSRSQDALRKLRSELVESLSDVEAQLEALGGSASTVTAKSAATAKSFATTKSLVPPSTISEE